MVKFNLIGFNRNTIDTKEYRHCSIHKYKRLLPHKTDQDLLFCPECGSEFPVKIEDSTIVQNIESNLPTNSCPKIITAKPKRKFYDSFANLIPEDDLDAIRDMQAGRRIVYYKEDKVQGEEQNHIAK